MFRVVVVVVICRLLSLWTIRPALQMFLWSNGQSFSDRLVNVCVILCRLLVILDLGWLILTARSIGGWLGPRCGISVLITSWNILGMFVTIRALLTENLGVVDVVPLTSAVLMGTWVTCRWPLATLILCVV